MQTVKTKHKSVKDYAEVRAETEILNGLREQRKLVEHQLLNLEAGARSATGARGKALALLDGGNETAGPTADELREQSHVLLEAIRIQEQRVSDAMESGYQKIAAAARDDHVRLLKKIVKAGREFGGALDAESALMNSLGSAGKYITRPPVYKDCLLKEAKWMGSHTRSRLAEFIERVEQIIKEQ